MTPSLRLTAANAPLTHTVDARDEFGQIRRISIPAERPLTVFVDKRDIGAAQMSGVRVANVYAIVFGLGAGLAGA